ncbi:MAG: HNH endonuclease [Methyloprofundus sp.]|nr:HNH endonuclease [Methyloprofundus sp.]
MSVHDGAEYAWPEAGQFSWPLTFGIWLSNWSYNSKSNHLKIKVLFAKLIKGSLDGERLVERNFALNIRNASKLQLDHMEASNPNIDNIDAYFTDEDRELYVNGLGNMMPLPDSENREKSNSPLSNSFPHFENAGIAPGHFLYDEALSCFEENSININGNTVPNQSFFQQRKQRLIGLFELAVNGI